MTTPEVQRPQVSEHQPTRHIEHSGTAPLSLWKPDVYRHSFVPQSFTGINQSPALLIHTPTIEGINFQNYINTFAGRQFLSTLEPVSYPGFEDQNPTSLLDGLRPQNYGQYFITALAMDLKARIPEIRSYDLFGVALQPRDYTQQIYSLVIPGLREGTPSVYLGDLILLRQLLIDPATSRPSGMDGWLASGGGQGRGEQAPGFTGYQLNAVVVAINRAKEMLLVRAHGMMGAAKIVCNVSFAVQDREIQGSFRAASDIGKGLSWEPIIMEVRNSTGNVENKSGSNFANDQRVLGTDASHSFDSPTSIYNARPPSSTMITRSEINLLHERNDSHWLQRVLFPTERQGIQQTTLPSAVFPQAFFDSNLNYEQKKAVDAVLTTNYGDFCYLINGPPGTGKTKTLCEIMTQLGKDPGNPGSLLLCAPSNPAADTLALRLRGLFDPKSLFRLNHFSRTFAEVPQELLSYCYVENDFFSLPPIASLMSFKVVIATCQAADILVQARVTNRDLTSLQDGLAQIIHSTPRQGQDSLHWTALLLDEAAQATEPESLIPLSVVAPPADFVGQSPIFVMAGDQHQLNSRTYNQDTNLHVSLFERLSNTTVYADHPSARRNLHHSSSNNLRRLRPPFVDLIRNYRSHSAILAIPSSLFYDNTLLPEATHTDSLSSWSGWRGRRWPVLFACNAGIDSCEDVRSVGGGWFNMREAQKAIAYAKSLLAESPIYDESEICIMSPFQAQVDLLRRLARQAKMRRLNIGPLRAFQGLESRLVIICTTRARTRFLEEDTIRGLGVVNERKKFNVAITRAKEGLVVLGNPRVLATDHYWRTFLEFCWRNSLWQFDSDELKIPTRDFEEQDANDWKPKSPHHTLSGLEAALVYKERDKTSGSHAARRFMNGAETLEDAIWRSGHEAQQTVLPGQFDPQEFS